MHKAVKISLIIAAVIAVLIILIYVGIRKYFDYRTSNSRGRSLQLSTPPILGICPTDWEKKVYAGISMCVEPGCNIYVNKYGQPTGSGRFGCQPGSVVGSSGTPGTPGYEDYYCEIPPNLNK